MIYLRYETYNHEQRILNEDLSSLKNNIEIVRRNYEGPIVLVTGDSWSAGEWDIDRVMTCKGGWVNTQNKKEIALGKGGKGILIVEKVNKRSITSLEKSLKEACEGIKNHQWPMKWSDYFCPQWCDFSMSCESEMNGLDNLW